MAKTPVRYFVFDVESAADPELVAKVRHPGENIAPIDAVQQYRAELLKKLTGPRTTCPSMPE